MKVLICGGRDYADIDTVRKHLSELPPDTVIVHGGALGADSLADRVATDLGFEVRRYPADWKRYGKSAGPRRNRQMLAEESPELVIAFPGGVGTKDMIDIAFAAGVLVKQILREPYILKAQIV